MSKSPLPLVLTLTLFSLATALAADAPNTGVKALRDIEYVPGGGRPRMLDLFLPEKSTAALPLVVWIHGGAWSAGSKEGGPAPRLVAEGFAVASINYRLSQQAIFPAQIEDCKAAIRFLRGHAKEYGIDAGHIGVFGASAGGHLVALLGTSGDVKDLEGKDGDLAVSSRVQAVCDWFGPTDLTKMAAQSGPESRLNHDAPQSPESRLVGGPIQERKELASRANPLTYVSRDDPPFLIMHGDRDPLVPLKQSQDLDEALRAAGAESKLQIIAGAGHGGPGFDKPEAVQMIREFFARHLRPAP
ncbi:MAG: alpha/beta hydrolase [Chthoniobacter sp.]|nr:alpha/beta hydrolase [Chthoniobacter sp.]